MEDLYDGTRRTLGEIIPLETPDIEDEIHIRTAFYNAYNRLSEQDADIIYLLMCGYKFKDISVSVKNARYRIKIARKRFKSELRACGITL